MFKQNFKKAFRFIFDIDENLSLENRLYLSSILVGILICLISTTIVSIISPSKIAVIANLVLFGLLIILYWLVKFKRVFEPFKIPIIIVGFLGISTIWVFDGGMNGPDMMIALVILMLALIMVPYKTKKYIVTFFILLVVILYLIQFFRPDLIIKIPSESNRWFDSFLVAVYCSIFIFLIIRFVHNHYSIERRRAEESDTKFRRYIDNAPEGVFVMNSDGFFIDVNPIVCNLFGYSKEEFLTMHSSKLVSKEFLPEYKDIINSIIRDDKHLQEINFISKNGNTFIGLLQSSKINENQFIGFVQDITKRKLAEKALIESEEKYRLLAENISDVIWIFNVTMQKFTYISPSVFQLRGYTVEEAMNQSLEESLAPDSISIVRKLVPLGVKEFLENPNQKKHYYQELLQSCKKGDFIWIETIVQFQFSINNEIEVLGVSRDIEQRKKSELALKQSEENYKKIIENLTDIYYRADINGKIVLVSPSCIDVFGLSSMNEVFERTIDSLYKNPNERDEFIALLKKTGKVKNYRTVMLRNDGSEVFVETTANILLDNNGKYIGVEGIVRDITERKRAEKTLMESENRFRNISSIISDIAYSCARSKDGEFRINWVMGAVEKIVGYTEDELLSMGCWGKIVIKDDFSLFKSNVVDLERGDFKYCELRVKHKDGHTIWVGSYAECHSSEENEEMLILYGGIVDISERKQVEENQNRLNKQLMELNATKDKLFSIIAHDLRSPFTAILGFSELLNSHAQKEIDAKSEDYLKIINSTAKSTLNLLDNLLAWARIQNGTLEFKPFDLHLQQIVNEVIEIIKPNAKIKNISVVSSQLEGTIVYADQNMIQIVLRNLLSNAIKFTNKDGTIQIIAAPNNSEVRITIKDNGIGICEELRNNLFKINANTTMIGTEEEKGSGIGLILCKEFIEKHGGRIWVESEEGKGSEFNFTLPNKCI